MSNFFHALFSSDHFMPHGHCYQWEPGVLALHIISDALIAVAYFSIPFTLLYFARKRRDLEFNWMFLCFAVFIVACGVTHLMEIWVIWHPTYWLSGGFKAITALASVPTAILLVKLVPKALHLPSPSALREINLAMEKEIAVRKRAEEDVRRANEELEHRVSERTASLEAANRALAEEIAERQRAESAGWESQRLLEAISDNSPAVIYAKDLNGRYLLANRRFGEIFNLSREEILGRTDYDIFSREAADAFRALDERVAAAGHALTEEETAPQSDGPHTFVSVKCPLRDHADKIYGVFGISTDITERKRTEEALSGSLAHTRAILETAIDGVVTMNHEGNIVEFNPAAETIFGYRSDDVIGRQLSDVIVPPRLRERHRRGLAHYLATGEGPVLGKRIELAGLRADGSEVLVELSIARMPVAGPARFTAFVRDITERKTAEEMLRASTKEVIDLKAALDEHAIVAITDPRGKISYVNDKFCTISKYSREELLGQDHRIINSGYHTKEFIRDLWSTIGSGHVWHGEIKNKAKDGSFYWVDTTIVPFLDEQGKPRQYVAIRADITDRKAAAETIRGLNTDLEQRVEERTAQLESANRELEAFSYSVSHDLRAPLRAVDGFSQAVLEDYAALLPDEGRRFLQTIRSSAQRMGALIDDLLTFSRLSRLPLTKQQVNTGGLVREVLADLGPQIDHRRIEIRTGELPACDGDPSLLKQVWLNLISNAVKYTGKHEAAVVEIGCEIKGETPVFLVRDNGIGFDMGYAGKLFGVFQRLHRLEEYEGTGVGLAIVQRIVQRHGGRVWAEAAPNRGATFYFTLQGETKL